MSHETTKEMVRQKYTEIAAQDKGTMPRPAAALAAAPPKCTIL